MKHVFCFLLTFTLGPCLSGQSNFEVDLNLRNQIRKEVWDELKVKTPDQQRSVMGLFFLGNGAFKTYEAAAKTYGYPANDLITASAFLEVLCREIMDSRTFNKKEIDAVFKDQAQRIFASVEQQSLDMIALQKRSDPLILTAIWLHNLNQMSKGDKGEVQELARLCLVALPKATLTNAANEIGGIAAADEKMKVQEPKKPSKPALDNSATGNIESIIMRTATSYGLNGVYVTNDVCVLYGNGDMFSNPQAPLESFNISASKKEQISKWDTWEKRNGQLFVIRSKTGKEYHWKKWFVLSPVAYDYKINGKFSTIDPFGGAVVINASTVFFDDNGRFAWDNIKGGSSDIASAYIKSQYKGSYHISKHTITLTYSDGTKESYFFGLYPNGKKHFILGESHFVPED